MDIERNCQSCKYYKDGYCENLELKPCYPSKGCGDFSKRNELKKDTMEVLDKIRAEIIELTKCPYGTECLGANCPSNIDCMICGDHVLEILDKYKAESEDKEQK